MHKVQGLGRGVSHRFREGASNQTLSCTHTCGALSKPVAHSVSLVLYTMTKEKTTPQFPNNPKRTLVGLKWCCSLLALSRAMCSALTRLRWPPRRPAPPGKPCRFSVTFSNEGIMSASVLIHQEVYRKDWAKQHVEKRLRKREKKKSREEATAWRSAAKKVSYIQGDKQCLQVNHWTMQKVASGVKLNGDVYGFYVEDPAWIDFVLLLRSKCADTVYMNCEECM